MEISLMQFHMLVWIFIQFEIHQCHLLKKFEPFQKLLYKQNEELSEKHFAYFIFVFIQLRNY